MHALHSLAHRAPATRTRLRWQPYNPIPAPLCSSITTRSSPSPYLNTPASSVTSSPSSITSAPDNSKTIQSITHPPLKQEPPRDAHKSKYAVGLVDQAIKSLSEIWRPQDIPNIFLSSSRSVSIADGSSEAGFFTDRKHSRGKDRNTQLPSPISPTTKPSPVTPSSSTTSDSRSEQDSAMATNCSGSSLVPIKGFVHEVLRRSRTSGCVLQTALCYLEAIRSKVPELIRQEKAGESLECMPANEDRIIVASEAEIQREREASQELTTTISANQIAEDNIPTIRIQDDDNAPCLLALEYGPLKTEVALGLPPPPSRPYAFSPSTTSHLPSPLLCPRRTFLAALILASKFTQDKCYSNKAWAKLSGLPPREIGRCERALGEALEWRLWVGKQPVSIPAASGPTSSRPIVRSQSEGSVSCGPSAQGPFLSPSQIDNCLYPPSRPSVGLRRCATMPYKGNTITNPSHNSNSWLSSAQLDLPSENPASALSTSPVQGYLDVMQQSPSPQTPALTYSPTSTDSSSGDHTIQMSTFLDDTMPPLSTSSIASLETSFSDWTGYDSADDKSLALASGMGNNLPGSFLKGQGPHWPETNPTAFAHNILPFVMPELSACPWGTDNGISPYCIHGSQQ